MFLQLVLLACFFAFVAAGKYDAKPVQCPKLHKCQGRYNDYRLPTNPAFLSKLKNNDTIDDFCTAVANIGACVEKSKAGCSSLEELAKAEDLVPITKFLCSPENKKAFLEVVKLKKTCLDNTPEGAELKKEVKQCGKDNLGEIDKAKKEIKSGSKKLTALCSPLRKLAECVDSKTAKICHGKIASFGDKLRKFALDTRGKAMGCPPGTKGLKMCTSLEFFLVTSNANGQIYEIITITCS